MKIHIRKKYEKICNYLRCKINRVPSNCILGKNVKLYNVKLAGRNKIDANSAIYETEVGYGTFVAKGSEIGNSKIGNYSMVGFKALLGSHPIHTVASVHPALYSNRAQYGFTYVQKSTYDEYRYVDENLKINIIIGNDVWATGSVQIVQGVTIGDGAVILAGAVVTKSIPPYAIAGGIPAKVLGFRFEKEDIDFLMELKWWDKGEIWIEEHAKYFEDIKYLKEVVKAEKCCTL